MLQRVDKCSPVLLGYDRQRRAQSTLALHSTTRRRWSFVARQCTWPSTAQLAGAGAPWHGNVHGGAPCQGSSLWASEATGWAAPFKEEPAGSVRHSAGIRGRYIWCWSMAWSGNHHSTTQAHSTNHHRSTNQRLLSGQHTQRPRGRLSSNGHASVEV